MKLNRRSISIIVAALIVVGLIVYGFMPKPAEVEVSEVTRGAFRVTLEEEGKTRVKDRFVISAPVSGFARRVELDVGDGVKKGATLVILEPQRSRVLDPRSMAEARARVSATEAGVKVAKENSRATKADADYAVKELARISELYKDGFASKENFEQSEAAATRAEARLSSANFAVEVAKGELTAARTALSFSSGEASGTTKVIVRAPIGGQVLRLHHESEGVVREGEPLLEIGDPRALEVIVDVLSEDSVSIRPGTPVIFERWGGEVVLEGLVRFVEPTGFTKVSALGVEEQRVFVIADITSKKALWERLGDGYRVEARFILWQGSDVLQLPSSALFRFNDGWAVFVMEGNKAWRRIVEIGKRGGLVTEVVSGVDVGVQVITHPDDEISDGRSVKRR
ncbi:MAG: HlyD family efflux transporter periplasmic adaptor subunit [Deltaproteobacteria bacterium]|nr:HlyD family efflux transporter periplasmic adaptor subunit [Deltaproteobacteria bacterium]